MKEDKKLRIIFVGIPDMALVCLSNLLEKKFNIVGVVPPQKTHETYKYFREFISNNGLNLIDFEKSPNEDSCINKIKELNADIGVVCSYNRKLSGDFLKTTKMGYINSHPSLLPDYRGAMPYFHIIKDGLKVSGITLHFMDEEFDTGDIIYQNSFDIMPWETMGTLFNRTTYMISDALVEILEKIERGEELKRTPQPKDGSFKAAFKVDGNFRLRWNKTALESERLIRACNPFYNAFTNFRGVTMKVIKASAIPKEHNLTLGQVALANENNFLVAAKDGFLSIELMQIGTWGIFNTKEFFYTFSPKTDEVLG